MNISGPSKGLAYTSSVTMVDADEWQSAGNA
jgi:hypothetical protein